MNRGKAAELAKQTLEICEQGYYIAGPRSERVSISIDLEKAIEETIYYPQACVPIQFEKDNTRNSCECQVLEVTTLQAASMFANEFNNLGVLNFASAKNPGGGFLKGSRAQEESLARSSGLYSCLITKPEFYSSNRDKICLYSNGVIYSPKVPVFRCDEGKLLETPYNVSFITCPAVNTKVALKRITDYPDKVTEEAMEKRIDSFLSVAVDQQCDALILGAFGCGVFGNSPSYVSKIFKKFLVGPNAKYSKSFSKAIFAVPSMGDRTTFQIFQKEF